MASKDSSDPDLDQRIAARWLDVLIRACQLLSLVLLSFRALAPFLVLMVWALILAVTLHPLHLAIARNQDVLTYGAQQASADFAAQHSTPQRQFLLAAGSAGIDAATNIVVRQAWTQMLLLVYAAVTVLCFITFRSWRAGCSRATHPAIKVADYLRTGRWRCPAGCSRTTHLAIKVADYLRTGRWR